MPKLTGCLLLLCVGMVTMACSAAPTLQEQPSTEFSTAGLHPVTSSGFEAAYVRPGAGLSSYRSVNIEDLDASDVHIPRTTAPGTLRRDWQITPEREANLTAAWARAMDRFFTGYERAATGDKGLRITARLTRVEPGRTSASGSVGSGVPGTSADTVDISAEFRLYDQGSGDLLAVIRDRRTIGMAQWSRAAGVDMVSLFNAWAALLHTRVSGR